jgi:bifunctional non-homologous end joining protein LigD
VNSLQKYREKRNFAKTPEPRGHRAANSSASFVVQRHSARRLHYDFRLEVDGTLKSWAVPKGPPLEGGEKRLAIQVEDHPLEYGKFEGKIPEGNYGAGDVRIWDRGTFTTEGSEPAGTQIKNGELKFRLEGTRLRGRHVLVKLKHSTRGNEWLLIRKAGGNDDADPPTTPVAAGPSKSPAKPHSAKPSPTKRNSNGRAENTAVVDPMSLPGAVRAKMPPQIRVALATPVDEAFSNPDWLFEIKWDGERALMFFRDGGIEIRARSGRDITHEYPEFRNAARALAARNAIVDGEIVTLDAQGRSDFKKLQSRFGVVNPSAALIEKAPAVYYAFDLIYCDGADLRRVPLIERKALLQRLLRPTPEIRYSDHEETNGKELFALARERGLEGIVAKQKRSHYAEGRSRNWLKIKISHELDVVIGGWTAPRKSREHFGALLMGLYRGKNLEYIGSVGTGFTGESLDDIQRQLQRIKTSRSPFHTPPKVKEAITWVEPKLVAKVEYNEWTADQKLRQPVFAGFREDRTPESCTFEGQIEQPPPRSSKKAAVPPRKGIDPPSSPPRLNIRAGGASMVDGESALEEELASGKSESIAARLDGKELALSHLNKVYFPQDGYTKRDLLLYYLRISKYILPFLVDRPLVLKRYPNGIDAKFFFQKEAPESRPEWMRTVTIYSKEREADMQYFVADDTAALLYLTNLGCIDHNPWSSRADDELHPDYLFFDFDPTEGTPFASVVAVAKAAESRLQKLGIRSFLKTSGASGLHIYVPLKRGYTYDQARMFATAVAEMVREDVPALVTFERSVARRAEGSVLIDTLQNARGKPLAAAYSVRPFPGAPVSTPIVPEELTSKLRADSWTMKTISARLRQHGDLWKDFWHRRQGIESAVKRAASQKR